MSLDFAALTAAVGVGLPEFRACLLLSRDGLVLAAHPVVEEPRAMNVWARMTSLGELERGFVEVADEFWAFVRRGPYSAVAVAGRGARPGLVLDRLDQMLLAAEESRARREAVRPAREPAPTEQPRGLRSTLHPEARPGTPAPALTQAPRPVAPTPPVAPAPPPGPTVKRETDPVVASAPPKPSALPAETEGSSDRTQWEIDVIALAREFAGIVSDTTDEEDGAQ